MIPPAISGKVLVIGSNSGIGTAVLERLGKDERYADLRLYSTDHHELNVRHQENMVKVLSRREYSHIVYCPGWNRLCPISELSADVLKTHYEVNVMGFVYMLKYQASMRIPTRVVVLSSDAATRPMRMSLAYCASKAALDMAVRVAARELASLDIVVNAVSPGMTEGTAMTDYIDHMVPKMRGWTPEKARAYEESQIPLGRRASTAEVAQVVVDTLTGPEYLTGSVLTINGGR